MLYRRRTEVHVHPLIFGESPAGFLSRCPTARPRSYRNCKAPLISDASLNVLAAALGQYHNPNNCSWSCHPRNPGDNFADSGGSGLRNCLRHMARRRIRRRPFSRTGFFAFLVPRGVRDGIRRDGAGITTSDVKDVTSHAKHFTRGRFSVDPKRPVRNYRTPQWKTTLGVRMP